MEASPRVRGMYYRCPARTLPNGSLALGTHPPTIYLREDVLQDAVNKWLGSLFDPKNVDRTVAALVASQGTETPTNIEAARKRLAKAEQELSRYQAAIKAGIDPLALVEPMNAAQAARAAAKAELEGAPAPTALTAAEVHAMIDSLGDVGAALNGAKVESLANLYSALDLQVHYKDKAHVADVMIKPVGYVNSAGVREVCPNTHLWGISHSSRRGVAHKPSLAGV
ncbi:MULTISPECIES: hypothetical protein [unclassified Saccharothrix]|uniref:hypothetical protein n=1 Tax=unclassified Saccharothrix TaxID=2593673 RepID=UPI00307EC1BC